MAPIKIAIADDNRLFRESLCFIFEKQQAFKITTSVSNGAELLTSLRSETPDVILMDLRMPIIDGNEAIRLIRLENPDIRILILSMHHEHALILNLLESGADGFLLKNTSALELARAIRTVHEIGYYFSDYVYNEVLQSINKGDGIIPTKKDWVTVSIEEEQFLNLIWKGLSLQKISEITFVSNIMILDCKKRLFEKFAVNNISGLIVKAIKLQIISQKSSNFS